VANFVFAPSFVSDGGSSSTHEGEQPDGPGGRGQKGPARLFFRKVKAASRPSNPSAAFTPLDTPAQNSRNCTGEVSLSRPGRRRSLGRADRRLRPHGLHAGACFLRRSSFSFSFALRTMMWISPSALLPRSDPMSIFAAAENGDLHLSVVSSQRAGPSPYDFTQRGVRFFRRRYRDRALSSSSHPMRWMSRGSSVSTSRRSTRCASLASLDTCFRKRQPSIDRRSPVGQNPKNLLCARLVCCSGSGLHIRFLGSPHRQTSCSNGGSPFLSAILLLASALSRLT